MAREMVGVACEMVGVAREMVGVVCEMVGVVCETDSWHQFMMQVHILSSIILSLKNKVMEKG